MLCYTMYELHAYACMWHKQCLASRLEAAALGAGDGEGALVHADVAAQGLRPQLSNTVI